jgi:hypothetical protein
MSFEEIKAKVWTLSTEERFELGKLLMHLSLQNDPEYRTEMERRMSEMDAGKKYTLDDVERLAREGVAHAK